MTGRVSEPERAPLHFHQKRDATAATFEVKSPFPLTLYTASMTPELGGHSRDFGVAAVLETRSRRGGSWTLCKRH